MHGCTFDTSVQVLSRLKTTFSKQLATLMARSKTQVSSHHMQVHTCEGTKIEPFKRQALWNLKFQRWRRSPLAHKVVSSTLLMSVMLWSFEVQNLRHAVLFKVTRHSEDFIRKYVKRKSTKTYSEFCGIRKFIRKVRSKSQLLVASTVKLKTLRG
uniref:Uncharacterized protein n=1 Tax=Setaria viridis TaxID=4556 RepID=A0A4U6W4G1_SETVI|nr:hypothetical protein SEVIR_2G442900v2 [Setaria viridis]